jgi:aspartate/methionine/tyrosine aminotransferase
MTSPTNAAVIAATPASPPVGGRLSDLSPSGTMEVGTVVRRLRSEGVNVINLGGGMAEPDAPCLREPVLFPGELNVGSDPAGEADLRAALALKLGRDLGLAYDPATEIVVTTGAKQAVLPTLLSVIEPGDEVLVLDPCWVTYAPAVQLAGGVARRVPMRQGGGFRLDADVLAAQVTAKTRAMILNSPHNPTGRVFTAEELAAAASVACANDLWVLSDESFDKFVFDGHRHLSIAALDGMRDRTAVIQSFSKAFALPGTRVGYLAAPEPLCRSVTRFNEHVITCVSPLMQSVALAALEDEAGWTDRLLAHYREKRDVAHEALARMPGLRFAPTEGTFYAFVDITAHGLSSRGFTARLLETARVAVTAGSAFGAGAEGYVRVNLVGPLSDIREGLRRMREALA